MRKTRKFLVTTALVGCLMSTPAFANDAATLKKLEKTLEKAMSLIETQSEQMQEMKHEITALKKDKTTEISALKSEISAVRAARVEPAAGSNADLERRLSDVEMVVADVEETVFDLDERAGSETIVNAFDASNFDIGGFVNTAYTYVDGEDGSAHGWNRQNFELLIRADLNEQWSAFFAGGFLREGNVSFDDDGDGTLNEAGERRNPDFVIEAASPGGTRTPQIIAWVNYKHDDALNAKLGRMITPLGIINQEHFPATLLDQEQPLFLRPFGGQTMFPNFTTGLQAHGQFFFDDNTLSYNAFAASAQGAIEEEIFGGRVAYDFGEMGVTVGVQAATGSRTEGVDGDYDLVGADLLVDKGPVLWKSEVFATEEEDVPGRLGYYTQPAWRVNDQWVAFYRYDFLDDGANGTAAVPDNFGDVTEHMVGVNYLPIPNVRTRLTATRREYESSGTQGSAEADILQFSTTYSF